jgi:hypothetical protein
MSGIQCVESGCNRVFQFESGVAFERVYKTVWDHYKKAHADIEVHDDCVRYWVDENDRVGDEMLSGMMEKLGKELT